MHPLRPQEGYVLVCEGNDDAVFLNGILPKYLSDFNLSIFDAGGSQNVPLLASILLPSVYIRDRDFDVSFDQAERSFKNEKPFTAWKRHDMESYLVYPDWLYQVAMDAQSSPKLHIRNVPKNEEVVHQQIHQIARTLVIDHAGRKTLAVMTKRLGTGIHLQYKPNRHIVSGGAEASQQQDWEKLLTQENSRIQDALTKASMMTLQDVMDEFHQQIKFYDSAKNNFGHLQQEFSGKRIIQMLAKEWNLKNRTKNSTDNTEKKPWQVIQNRLIYYAQNQVTLHKGFLSDDDRLGDVGLLASKVFGTKI